MMEWGVCGWERVSMCECACGGHSRHVLLWAKGRGEWSFTEELGYPNGV